MEFERITRELNQNVFECLAQNSYGISLPADVKLNVLYAPSQVNTSSSESVSVGSDAQLACIFDGNPEPEVKWLYTDPLSRSGAASQLAELSHPQPPGTSRQFLTIRNVTYRNEGDYHCEARNQINGLSYAVRSSNMILDVFGEPQFLLKVSQESPEASTRPLTRPPVSDPTNSRSRPRNKSPQDARAIRGSRSELSLTFCSDPPPSKVFWQFGSIRLDVR